MPYSSIDQLPPPIRNNLPAPAQHIFVEAFNDAYSRLKPGEDEVPAFKIGWSAVKKSYEKKRQMAAKEEKPHHNPLSKERRLN